MDGPGAARVRRFSWGVTQRLGAVERLLTAKLVEIIPESPAGERMER